MLDAVRSGPLHRHVEAVQALLRDPTQTRVLTVTLAEELPIRETLELRSQLASLGIAAGPIIVNGLEPRLQLDAERASRALQATPEAPEGVHPTPAEGLWLLRHYGARSRLQADFLLELEHSSDAALLGLPYLEQALDGARACGELADNLERAFASGEAQ